MNFSSLTFWFHIIQLLFFVYVSRFCIKKFTQISLHLFDKIALGFISSALLFFESPVTFFVFLYVFLVTMIGKRLLKKWINYREILLCILIFLQISPLLFFKYSIFILNLFSDGLNRVDNTTSMSMLIPVGISFYSFQLIGYLVDETKSKQSEESFIDDFNFACFFPQIVAGPIERKAKLLPQIQNFTFNLTACNFNAGIKWVIAGLFYKLVLGDNLAEISSWCQDPSTNPFAILLGSFLFGLRIYYDFAGYSLIAVGLGQFFGISLTQNFLSPYTALNIREFWSRWHRTLSLWFRDYIYFPMGGGRGRSWGINILVVFVISGIWHGAGWNFILWGLFHGCMLVLYKLVGSRFRIHPFFQWFSTMFFVTISWLFFYEVNVDQLIVKLKAIIQPAGYNVGNLYNLKSFFGTNLDCLTALFTIFAITSVICIEYIGMKKKENPYLIWGNYFSLSFASLMIYLCTPLNTTTFVYFNF